jgi:DNA polymerase theta
MCESLATQISRVFFNIGNENSVIAPPEVSASLRDQLNGVQLEEVLRQLKECPAGLDLNLKKSVQFGCCFHHAGKSSNIKYCVVNFTMYNITLTGSLFLSLGLTFDERDILESAFKRGIIRVMTATTTLSAGVNLPARRVLIKTPDFGTNLDVMTYRQMSGRAGRTGVDTEGESVLICNTLSQRRAIDLIQSNLQPVRSALLAENGLLTASMKRALLEVVASKLTDVNFKVGKLDSSFSYFYQGWLAWLRLNAFHNFIKGTYLH